MSDYRIRSASVADADALVRHRIGMFTDMKVAMDADALARAFRAWLDTAMPAGVYRAWVVETEAGEIVAGAGITVPPWPPGPHNAGDSLAWVYSLYVEPAHRRRAVARRLMDEIHRWCRNAGMTSIVLNASAAARPLYESMGYSLSPNPMMFFALGGGDWQKPAALR
jgi:GNAT superfamily N-acetyltransferase